MGLINQLITGGPHIVRIKGFLDVLGLCTGLNEGLLTIKNQSGVTRAYFMTPASTEKIYFSNKKKTQSKTESPKKTKKNDRKNHQKKYKK